MWVSKGGPPDKPVVLFDYDPSRGKDVAARLLDSFEGTLQCDGLASYDSLAQSNDTLVLLGCFDHARRKYVEALKGTGATVDKTGHGKKTAAPCKAAIGLGKINALYRLERSINDLPAREKYQYRQRVAVPLLDDFKAVTGHSLPNIGLFVKRLIPMVKVEQSCFFVLQ
jgi:hypothetical protein